MKTKLFLYSFITIAFVVIASIGVNTLWQDKPEEINLPTSLIISQQDTLEVFAKKNQLLNEVVLKAFNQTSENGLNKTIGSFNLSYEKIQESVVKSIALKQEHDSKNWKKILLKFLLWFSFLGFIFYLVKNKKVTPKNRKYLYLSSFILFGVLLGADPSAMGTIKDAVVLYASSGAVFPPRMIALTVFLLLVFFANKFFCGWGCQFGSLQDFIYRLNRNKKDTKALTVQYKIPFYITNGIRVSFFIIFTLIAFIWTFDLFEYIDPFKIFKADKLPLIGMFFVGGLLIASLFVYRPWCKMFCPFGLASWFVEKISIFKIRVNYNTCISCNSCEKVCPTDAMGTILKQQSTISDCFACNSCINACPTDSISFSKEKREKVPEGKFDKK